MVSKECPYPTPLRLFQSPKSTPPLTTPLRLLIPSGRTRSPAPLHCHLPRLPETTASRASIDEGGVGDGYKMEAVT